jgi:hypothetical protein
VTVTFVGETETVEPLIGEVLTNVLAPAEIGFNERKLNERIMAAKEKRKLTIYNKFMQEKMKELENSIIPSKLRFKKASTMWIKD